jgi:hypothetical protein
LKRRNQARGPTAIGQRDVRSVFHSQLPPPSSFRRGPRDSTNRGQAGCLDGGRDMLRPRQLQAPTRRRGWGEGFDFPELKIAGLHDIHQSLSVTIQFTGRFARSNSNIGSATIIVNRAIGEVDESVNSLFAATGGADWNLVLTQPTSTENARQMEKQEFFDSFALRDGSVHIQSVKPKMSTVVYETKCSNWNPYALKGLPIYRRRYGDLSVSVKEETAYLVTMEYNEVEWACSSKLTERSFDLCVFFWDSKLTGSTIKHDSFIQEMLVPEDITAPPDLFPLTIEWPDGLYRRGEESVLIGNGALSVPFFEITLELIEPQPASPLKFVVECEDFSSNYAIEFGPAGVSYRSDNDLMISFGKRRMVLSEYLARAHPIILYEKDCWGRGDQLFKLQERTLNNFDIDKIVTWSWNGVDLTKESQKLEKRPDSIQKRTIETISAPSWDRAYEVIFDDDSSGEAADVVGIAIDESALYVDLFHCKYTKTKPGRRLDDLYVVCGQAIRSVKQADDIDRFFLHLMYRERQRMKKHRVTRFERGDFKELSRLRALAHTVHREFRVFIVQPGLKKSIITPDLRDLLGSTELYLSTLRGIKLKVIGS